MNEVSLFNEKTMTVKEVAEALGVSTDTVKNCIRRIMPNKMQNGKTTYLNEIEVSAISKELKSNAYVEKHLTYEESSQVKNAVTAMELQQNFYQAAQAYAKYLEAEKARLEAENEAQKNRLAITEPKAKWYDDFGDGTNLFEIGAVGKELEPYGLGALKIFDRLKADKIIYEKTTDGVKSYYAYFSYKKYFAYRNNSFTKKDGKRISYQRLMFNALGKQWILGKYKAAQNAD